MHLTYAKKQVTLVRSTFIWAVETYSIIGMLLITFPGL